MKIKINKIGNSTERIIKNLGKNIAINVGHFEDQGQHYSGYTYPQLMELHHKGTGVGVGKIPARPVLTILTYRVFNKKAIIFKAIKNILKNPLTPNITIKNMLEIGNNIKKIEQKIFGDREELVRNAAFTNKSKKNSGNIGKPLLDTEDLKNKVEVRLVKNGKVVKDP